jgi:hypothetical protein
MNNVVEREGRVWFLSRPSLGAIIACVLAFGASSGLPNRTLSHSLSSSLGVAALLYGLAPALRDISDEFQRWAQVGGSLVLGASFGFLIRLIIR